MWRAGAPRTWVVSSAWRLGGVQVPGASSGFGEYTAPISVCAMWSLLRVIQTTFFVVPTVCPFSSSSTVLAQV